MRVIGKIINTVLKITVCFFFLMVLLGIMLTGSEEETVKEQPVQVAQANIEAEIEAERRQAEIEAERRQAEKRSAAIKRLFCAWDGSHRGLRRLVKQAMNDPDSFRADRTVYWIRGNYLIVRMDFRGKNVFGGVVRNWVKAVVDLEGNVIEILMQGP